MIDLTKKCTAYVGKLSKLPTPNINLCLLNLRRPISPVPGTRRATHEYRTRRPALNSFESCLSEPAAIAISIGYENKCHSLSILAHSINMALCKDSFTGNMRTFNYDEGPLSWEDYLARTSHVWSPEFSALLRKKGRKMARGKEGGGWFGMRSYRGWTEVIVWNLWNFLRMPIPSAMERDWRGLSRFSR